MKTDRASSRTLIGGLIILLAIAGYWAYLSRQGRRAEQEAKSPFYQMMPVLKVCGVHLTADQEHMLGHHGSVAIPFARLDKQGQTAVLAAVRREWTAKHGGAKMSAADRKTLEDILARMPQSLVGFQVVAPGSAYVYFRADVLPLPLHMVPGTRHVEQAHIELEAHGDEDHAQWERKEFSKPEPPSEAPAGGR